MVLWRAALTAHAVLSEDEAVAALPVDPDSARTWLRGHVRPRTVLAGVPLYAWGDVLDGLSGTGPRASPEDEPADEPVVGADAAATVLHVSRSAVDRRIRRLPAEARPVSVGSGRNGRWWWPSRAALIAWWSAPIPSEPVVGRRKNPDRFPGAAVDVRAALRDALARKGG
ncbi:MAG: hypothetical protein ACOZNI_12420 [Myxococcota bacterium]